MLPAIETIDDWMYVVWSDKVKFNCLNSDGQSYGYKRAGEGLGKGFLTDWWKKHKSLVVVL